MTLPLSYSRVPTAAFRLDLEGSDSTTELLPPKPVVGRPSLVVRQPNAPHAQLTSISGADDQD